MREGVVLLSGGLDSATVLGIADSELGRVRTLTFIYGQRADKEVECAKKLSQHYDVEEHMVLSIPLEKLTESSLFKGGTDIPSHKSADIPSTYVPARNIILLSMALAYAECVNAHAIYIGANAVDFSGYPDCRPEFYRAFRQMVKEGTKRGIEGDPVGIKVPLQNMSKKEIIQKGNELGVPFELTWSCYREGVTACGVCDSCVLRLKGFHEAGLEDPLAYNASTAPID